MPTWILLGCIIQYLLTLGLRPSLAVLPAFLLLSWGFIDALLMAFGIKKNTWANGVIDGKFAAGYPAEGQRSVTKPADNGPGAVMILGTRSNSPLGMFAPGRSYLILSLYVTSDKITGYKEIGDRFNDMVKQLEKDKTAGFMGMSSWLSTERTSSNEFATISYWRSIEDIHNFALSPVHRDAWNWWNDAVAKGGHKDLGIMHEVFEIPKERGFEGIYINYHPTGLCATTKLAEGGEKDKEEWVLPMIDARRGPFRSSRGRMARGDEMGSSNEKIAFDPYAV